MFPANTSASFPIAALIPENRNTTTATKTEMTVIAEQPGERLDWALGSALGASAMAMDTLSKNGVEGQCGEWSGGCIS